MTKPALLLRHRRKMQLGGGIAFALLALWLNGMTTVPARLHAPASSSPHTSPTFIDGYALMMILTIVAVAFAIAAFRGSLRLAPGIVAFLVLLGAALAVCYYR